VRTEDQKLAWMIILATIPVGVVGLLFEHAFRVIFGRPIIAGIFLAVNGLILLAGERYRSRASLAADAAIAAEPEPGPAIPAREPERAGAVRASPASPASPAALRQQEQADMIQADRRLASMSYSQAVVVGSAQVLALLAGISRDGVTIVAGMARGLSREDAARFAFLLATPVILAAGALKIPDLLGPLGHGIGGQILVGSVASGVGAYLSVRFLLRYLRTRTLTPFGVYCLIAGLGSVVYLGLVK
jgi:undecaprenyl-diphosphatase